MKKMRLLPVIIAALLLFSCGQPRDTASEPSYADSFEEKSLDGASSPDSLSGGQTDSLPESEASSSRQSAPLQASEDSAVPSASRPDAETPETIEIDETAEKTSHQKSAPQIPEAPFSLMDAEPYSGQPCTVVNGNVPYFSDDELTADSFTLYSELDNLGRCGTTYACIGLDLMPTEERGSIGDIRPTGWHTVKYNDIIDGNYLYNRCHLIGYLLSGENANERNLITGTRYLNVQGMLPFENTVADYVTETGNHVLYRVTPIFEGDNLLASGVLMEAESVEDRGEAVSFCVYVYNVQPGIAIDYATGESAIAPDASTAESAASPEEQPQGTAYILNTNTKKFHYPSCRSVSQMKEKNKQEYTGNREDVISMGYDPCKNCNP